VPFQNKSEPESQNKIKTSFPAAREAVPFPNLPQSWVSWYEDSGQKQAAMS
jgi:hypothetical protein